MKEMVYQATQKREILDTGYCFGLLYYILSLGTHPVAYIKIPKEHKLYKLNEDDIYKTCDIDVHGGITYVNDYLLTEMRENRRLFYRLGLCTLWRLYRV